MRRRNNRPDQHRATLPDLEVRKILSGGCANSRLLRVASPRGVSLPPLPRPRPTELTSPPTQPISEELAPASVQSDQTQMPTDPAATPEGPNEGPLND